MAHIIDARNNGGDVVILGDSFVIPTSTSTATPVAGSLRRNPTNGAIEAYIGVSNGAYVWKSITPGIGGGGVLSVTAGTGLTGGLIDVAGTIGLSNTGVAAGTYTLSTFVVNAQGRITSASSGAPVTLVASGIGLTGGPITTTGTLSLATTTVSAGTYLFPTIVVDAYGRLTSAVSEQVVLGVGTGTGLTGGPIGGAISSGIISLADTTVTPGTYTIGTLVVDAQGRITSATQRTTISIPDGTVASPSVFFGSETNTGVYKEASNTIGFSALGGIAFTMQGVASSVNYIRVTSTITAGTPSVSVQGSDTNISVALAAKGTGTVRLQTRGATALEVNATGTPGNFLRVNATASGGTPQILSQGTDSNVALQLSAKGAAAVSCSNPLQIPGYTVATLPAAATYTRCLVYVSDGTANKRLAISDGTNWRFPDGAIVS